MSTPLTIVATITANPGHEDEVEAALKALIAPTLAEPGCIQYDLHRDIEVPGRFLFFENWATREEWDTHMANDHLATFAAATEGKMSPVVLFQMERRHL